MNKKTQTNPKGAGRKKKEGNMKTRQLSIQIPVGIYDKFSIEAIYLRNNMLMEYKKDLQITGTDKP